MARRIGADLAASRFLAPVTADVMRWKYGKLLANLSNAIEAVCGHGWDDAAADLRRRATAEGTAVLDAAGIAYASGAESAEVRGNRVRIQPVNGSPRGGGSSWQSLTRGTGSIEADYLNGEIVLLGREHGVPAPVNEMLQRLANQAARERKAPGSITPGEVMAILATWRSSSGDRELIRWPGTQRAGRRRPGQPAVSRRDTRAVRHKDFRTERTVVRALIQLQPDRECGDPRGRDLSRVNVK